MEIVTIDARAFEAWKKKFEEFIERMDKICAPHCKKKEMWLDNSDYHILRLMVKFIIKLRMWMPLYRVK